MNRENIQYTIDLLKQAQSFNIHTFQSYGNGTVATSTEELHACGNTACIAGYVALSPRWKELGGQQTISGAPRPAVGYLIPEELDDAYGDIVVAGMAKFWGVSANTADAIVYGQEYDWLADHLGLHPKGWGDLEPADAVYLFEQLLIRGEPT